MIRFRFRGIPLHQIPFAWLVSVAGMAVIAYITQHELWMVSGAIALAAALIWGQELVGLRSLKAKQSHSLVSSLLSGTLMGVVLLDIAALPAQAQFMKKAEGFFVKFTQQAGMDEQVTNLIFGTLRGLFLLYLAISIIKVVQAARNDEDWQTLARTPLIIVVAIVIADVLTELII